MGFMTPNCLATCAWVAGKVGLPINFNVTLLPKGIHRRVLGLEE